MSVTPAGKGPGPHCPILYTVTPTVEAKDQCVAALRALGNCSGAEADKARQAAMKWLAQWYKEHNRLLWFYTTLRKGLHDATYAPKFQAFHRDPAQLRFLRAPNQVGKSYAAGADTLMYATGKHAWKPIPAKWGNPQIEKTILIVTGSDKNREGVYKALWNLAPIDEINWQDTHYDNRNLWGVRNPVILFHRTNTKIIFRSSNQDTDSLNSLTADGIWIDEPPDKRTINEIRRAGAARDAWITMSFTPVGEMGEDFTWLRLYVEGDEEHEPVGAWSQHVIGIPDCPWFNEEELSRRRSMYTAEDIPQRLYGEWDAAAIDREFTHFSEKDCVTDTWTIATDTAPEQLRFAVTLDHGEKARTQTAVFSAYRKGAPMVVFDEYVSQRRTTIEEDAQAIMRILRSYGLTVQQVGLWVGDINTGGKQAKGEKLNLLLARELARCSGAVLPEPVRAPKKYPGSVETEERRINQAFGERAILIHARCKNLIRSLRYYRGDGSRKDADLKHILDGFRYGAQVILNHLGVCMLYNPHYSGRAGRSTL